MNNVSRIPFCESVRLFWRHLIPIALLPTFVICVIGLTGRGWLFWFILPLFYWCSYYAGVPYSKKNATYWFWVFAGFVWVLGAIPGMIVFAIMKKLFGTWLL